MIGKLKNKMEAEKKKLEEKKRKESFLCAEVIDLLNKHVLQGTGRSTDFEVNLFDRTNRDRG